MKVVVQGLGCLGKCRRIAGGDEVARPKEGNNFSSFFFLHNFYMTHTHAPGKTLIHASHTKSTHKKKLGNVL
jgi:hypothetical protein